MNRDQSVIKKDAMEHWKNSYDYYQTFTIDKKFNI